MLSPESGTSMKRREFIKLLGGTAATWPLVARAELPKAGPHVGWLATGDPTTYRFSLAAFRGGLRTLGYVEGRNITVEYRWAEGNVSRLPELADELVQQKVDVIVAGGTIGARAAKHATSLIPIVAAGVGDLVAAGLVTNLAQPEGNLTGFVADAPETAAKRVQILKEIIPKAKHAAVIRTASNSYEDLEWKAVNEATTAVELIFTLYDVQNADDFESKVYAISKSGADIVVVLNSPFVFTYRRNIVGFMSKFRLPAIYGYREFADEGGLASYGANISDTYRRAAGYVDKILKGTKLGDLPIELPTKFELIVNLKTANSLGLTIPPTLLAIADEVIE
jgi:putative tryptophan/tyrosine transport system substrate-binding protein